MDREVLANALRPALIAGHLLVQGHALRVGRLDCTLLALLAAAAAALVWRPDADRSHRLARAADRALLLGYPAYLPHLGEGPAQAGALVDHWMALAVLLLGSVALARWLGWRLRPLRQAGVRVGGGRPAPVIGSSARLALPELPARRLPAPFVVWDGADGDDGGDLLWQDRDDSDLGAGKRGGGAMREGDPAQAGDEQASGDGTAPPARGALPCFDRASLLRLHFVAEAPLPDAPAATLWRSVLGRALRPMVCATGAAQCDGCGWQSRCDYGRCFPPDAADGGASPTITPLVLRSRADGLLCRLELVLLGRRPPDAGTLVHALARAGRDGLGRQRVVARLRAVERWCSHCQRWEAADGCPPGAIAVPAPPSGPLRLHLVTPLQLRRNGRVLGPEMLGVGDLFGALARRHRLLCRADGQPVGGSGVLPPLPPAEFERLVRVREVRWSARQRRRVPMAGVTGILRIDPDPALAPWWPLLWCGQYLHLGRQTTFGFGEYRLHCGRS